MIMQHILKHPIASRLITVSCRFLEQKRYLTNTGVYDPRLESLSVQNRGTGKESQVTAVIYADKLQSSTWPVFFLSLNSIRP